MLMMKKPKNGLGFPESYKEDSLELISVEPEED